MGQSQKRRYWFIYRSSDSSCLDKVNMEKRMDEDIETPIFLGVLGTQDSVTFRDLIAAELDGGIHAQSQNGGMQTEGVGKISGQNEEDEASAGEEDNPPNTEVEATDVPNNEEPTKSEPAERSGEQWNGGGRRRCRR